MGRTLASVQKIKAILPIEGADRIEVVQVLNWKCVAKKGEYKVDDLVVYFEIDSLLPDIPAFEWLKGSSWSQKLNRYKISTHKFRDQISQGLVVSIKDLKTIYDQVVEKTSGVIKVLDYPRCIEQPRLDDDLTEILDVEKYDPPVTLGALGEIVRHEWYVPKTDEERIQVCAENVLPKYMEAEKGDWYASIKLDGTSCTAGLFEDGYLYGGRSYFYKDENMYSRTIAKYGDLKAKLEKHLKETGEYVVFQGELCGPGIQKNRLKLTEGAWFIFNAFVSKTGENGTYEKVGLLRLLDLCERFELNTVPILNFEDKFDFHKTTDIDETVNNLLAYVDKFKYRTFFENADPGQTAEGVVFRMNDMTNSFKVVSNKYLLKGGE